MFRRKKNPERQYKVENVGNLIIEKVQMPHSLIEADGTRYDIVCWVVRFRVQSGAILIERSYAKGEPKAIEKMRGCINFDGVVEYETDAIHRFNREAFWPWVGIT